MAKQIGDRNLNRRSVLKALGVSAIGIGGLAGPATAQSLTSKISSNGHWDLNTGDTAGFFRSDTPFSKENYDGMVAVEPTRGGVHARLENLSTYGDAGFDLHVGKLGDIGQVVVESSGTVQMNLWLDENGDGEFFSWTNARGNTEKFAGYNGDSAKLGGDVGSGTTTVTTTSHTFSDKTIEGWVNEVGGDTLTALWFGTSGSGTKEVVVKSVSVQ